MNLQSLTIIFVIIFLPIILISTYYIQREVDTITLQTSYDTKLIAATTDAVTAFEINTANEDLTATADSLRSMIEASNNVFTTTMATNLGMSGATQSKILPYIPAIVYTLYDGYYIYSPTKQPKVLTDPDGVYVKVGDVGVREDAAGKYLYDYDLIKNTPDKSTLSKSKISNEEDYGKILYFAEDTNGKIGKNITCVTNPEIAYQTTSYILKSYIPYSMKYKKGEPSIDKEYDVIINYTLDNYITVYGTIDGVYYSKSGYLIDIDRVSDISIKLDELSIDDIDDLVKSKDDISLRVDGLEITSSNENSAMSEHYTGVMLSDNKSAVAYYLKAYMFSNWVKENLIDINPTTDILNDSKNLQQGFSIKQSGENLKDDAKLFWDYTEESIFKTNNDWNIENSNSNFYEHKRKVIKNSIQYSLNQAMATYNQGQGDEYYQMPILSEPEWDKLLSNVSVLAFMQGLPCGLKTYSNYALVTSTNNEIMANLEDIYYVPVKSSANILDNDFTGDDIWDLNEGKIGVLNSAERNMLDKIGYPMDDIKLATAHHIDCNDLAKGNDVLYYESFPAREIKYDKEYNSNTRKYEYDHVCSTCYNCIVNSNYNKSDYDIFKEIEQKKSDERTSEENNLYDDLKNRLYIKTFKKAELIAIAKIRNNTYKSCAVKTNYGLYVPPNIDKSIDCYQSYKLENATGCYEIQVTIKSKEDAGKSGTNSIKLGNEQFYYNCNNKDVVQSFVFSSPNDWGDAFITIGEHENEAEEKIKIDIVSITYKYK